LRASRRAPQDDLDVGFVSRRVARCDLDRRRSALSPRHRAAAAGTEHVPPCDPRDCRFGCGGTCDARCAEYVDYVLEKSRDVAR
jgi:hypothetical protein